MATVYIETQGCKLNQADSQALASCFLQAGYILVDEPAQADVHVVNTCTVTHVADRKARHALRVARRRNPRALVVATGCYAQRAPQQLAQFPGIDLVIGNEQKDALVERVTAVLGLEQATLSTDAPQNPRAGAGMRTRAMVKIQEGCDQVCAYCIVPRVRGRERSVHPDVLVKQVQGLVAEGYREVVLTGTQLGSYGHEIPGASLASLLRRLLEETAAPRFRVSSLQPQELGPELLEVWSDPRMCPHFHLPLQSGSVAVLNAMRRRYTPQQYVEAVETIHRVIPQGAITADVIVGFPGETEEQFQETYKLCQDTQFAGLHVFPFSVRAGTTAAYMTPQVPETVKRQRMELMLALATAQAYQFRTRLLGTTRQVLWETSRPAAEAPVWSGLTDNYVPVATASHKPLRNGITPLVLEHVDRETVWGRIP